MGNASSLFRCSALRATTPNRAALSNRSFRRIAGSVETLPALRDVYARQMGIVSDHDQLRPFDDGYVNLIPTSELLDRRLAVISNKYINFQDLTWDEYVQVFDATAKVVAQRRDIHRPTRTLDAHGSASVVKHGADGSYLLGAYHTAYPHVNFSPGADDRLCEEKEATHELKDISIYFSDKLSYTANVVWFDVERDMCLMQTNEVVPAPALELRPWPERVDAVDFICLVGYRARSTPTVDSFDHPISAEKIDKSFGAGKYKRSVSCLSTKYVDVVRDSPETPATAYLRDGLVKTGKKFLEVQNACLEGYSGGPVIIAHGAVSAVLVEGFEGSNNLVSPVLESDLAVLRGLN